MKNQLIYLLLLIVSILCNLSCSPDKKTNKDEFNIDPKSPKSIDLSESFANATIIPLETTKQSLVLFPDKVIQKGDNLYILDRRQRAILRFNIKGDYLNKIKSVQKPGPTEIGDMIDISYSEDDSLISVLGMSFIAKFSLDLEFKEKWKQRVGIGHHYWLNDSEILYHSNYLNPRNKTLVGVYNLNKMNETVCLIKKDEKVNIPFLQPSVILNKEFGKLLCLPLHDTIYTYKDGRINKHKTINFGKYKMPKKKLEYLNPQSFLGLEDGSHAFFNIRYFENGFNTIFSYHFNGKYFDYVYFNSEGIGVTVKEYRIGDKSLDIRRIGISEEDELIAWLEPDIIKSLNQQGYIKGNYQDIVQDSNPVLVLIKQIYNHEVQTGS